MPTEDDYMDVDLGRGSPKTTRKESPNVVEEPIIQEKKLRTLWEINYYLNYVDPEYRSINLVFDGEILPQLHEIRLEIALKRETDFKDRLEMIIIVQPQTILKKNVELCKSICGIRW